MMSPEEIAQQHDDRPGYRVVDFEEVGLPVYKIRSIVLTLEPKAFSAIEEFVLRTIEAGLTDPQEIAAFLGLATTLVEATASTLLREDSVKVNSDGTLSLTEKSRSILQGEKLKAPREQALIFWFDGLTRKPIEPPHALEPRYLKERGMREIRPYPSNRPEADEIDAEQLQKVLPGGKSKRVQSPDILQVQSVERAYMHFVPATALIFRSDTKSEIQVGFAIDGRLSKEHEAAFANSDGPQKSGMESAILKATAEKDQSGLNLPIGPLRGPKGSAIQRRQDAAERFRSKFADGDQKSSGAASAGVDMVSVYEHPELLRDAIQSSRRRLIIVSPWITPAVVDRTFMEKLKNLISSGVKVYIGYGLGDDRNFPKLENQLDELAKSNKNFTLARLGDTHAKILIKDDEYLVTTSFNWLSFRGDPRRAFREEWGMKVTIRDQVNAAADKFVRRISRSGERG
ncbi:hypothetical protein K3166_11015 [Qipengyuania psychrotolerans]|uniref:Phospholipase D-like domain-containing protein n=2 Tax=Qipengyuania psychrotolerans TaxID=2867238 RepID=A0ABX8ZCL5_9SPHN|nr:hypothetical protein K3166_11015 [Qipengyuania psychrotolerans]